MKKSLRAALRAGGKGPIISSSEPPPVADILTPSLRTITLRTAWRFVRFSAVGALGLGLKFGVLILMKSVFGVGYLLATTVAVEAAILHNFVLHSRWTWRDRSRDLTAREVLLRLVRLHLTSGAVTFAINIVIMRLAVGEAGLNYIVANVLATVAASALNFLLANWLVYVPPPPR